MNNPEESYKWALRILKLLTVHVSVISVASADEDSAAEVFETLNDRGVGLSTPDLLRNLVIRRATDRDRQVVVGLWSEVIQFESDQEIKSFLRHYWISHHGDVKTQRLYREIKRHIIDNSVSSMKFSRNLQETSVLYRQIRDGKDLDSDIEECFGELDELSASVLLPFSLSAMQAAPETDRCKLLRCAISAFVRHSIIGVRENSKLENEIHRLAKLMRSGAGFAEVRESLASFVPSDESFSESFSSFSTQKTAIQRYILRKLEMRSRETSEFRVNPGSKVHVEHIYPQTPAAGLALEDHDDVVNRLGNLTLLDKVKNTSIRNSEFSQKRESYKTSEVKITRELAKYRHWGLAQISERQREFSNLAVRIWSI